MFARLGSMSLMVVLSLAVVNRDGSVREGVRGRGGGGERVEESRMGLCWESLEVAISRAAYQPPFVRHVRRGA